MNPNPNVMKQFKEAICLCGHDMTFHGLSPFTYPCNFKDCKCGHFEREHSLKFEGSLRNHSADGLSIAVYVTCTECWKKGIKLIDIDNNDKEIQWCDKGRFDR